MIRALLEDRFKLSVPMESKEGPVYAGWLSRQPRETISMSGGAPG